MRKYYWKEWENVDAAIREKFPKLVDDGHCPALKLMCLAGIPYQAIKRFGGTAGICKRMKLRSGHGYISRDGHWLHSIPELVLDEYLFSRGIFHQPEIPPFSDRQCRCDQYLGNNIYVEIWGVTEKSTNYIMERRKDYLVRKKEKQRLYRQNHFVLIEFDYTFFDKPVDQITTVLDDTFARHGFDVSLKNSFDLTEIRRMLRGKATEEDIIDEIKRYIKQFGRFPRNIDLRRKKWTRLYDAIQTAGGLKKFRDLLQSPRSKYGTEERIIEEMNKHSCNGVIKWCDMPSALITAIKRFTPGIEFCLEKAGLTMPRKQPRRTGATWTKEMVEQSMAEIIARIGHFPTNQELARMEREDLLWGIRKYGGNKWLKEKFVCK